MNTITIKSLPTPYGYNENYLVIDGIPITEWFEKYKHNSEELSKFDLNGLYPAWGKELNLEGEKKFIHTLLFSEESEVVPVLVCEDDLDLGCIVLAAYVRKDKDFVYWDKIGDITHKNEGDDKKYGISYLEAYTYEDWEKYGDNIATEKTGSREWYKWISENWTEELYRRRMNYTRNYYKQPGSVIWLHEPKWIFDRKEYEKCIEFYQK